MLTDLYHEPRMGTWNSRREPARARLTICPTASTNSTSPRQVHLAILAPNVDGFVPEINFRSKGGWSSGDRKEETGRRQQRRSPRLRLGRSAAWPAPIAVGLCRRGPCSLRHMKTCARKADDVPYRIYQFDITEASSPVEQGKTANVFRALTSKARPESGLDCLIWAIFAMWTTRREPARGRLTTCPTASTNSTSLRQVHIYIYTYIYI